MSAPTNKAVNVIKSKFRSDIDELMKSKIGLQNDEENDLNLNDMLDKLEEKGFKINFLTLHKLLNYQTDFDIDGERIFVKNNKASMLNNYDLIIIDECSMIQYSMIIEVFNELNKLNITTYKIPKILFVGDCAQLNPVGERMSIIFAKQDKDFNIDQFKVAVKENTTEYFDNKNVDALKKKFDEFKSAIISQQSITMTEVMRSNDNNVVALCNEIRAWVLDNIIPNIGKYKGKKVYLYKKTHNDKLQTEWFKKAVEYFKSINNSEHVSNIILTWTNKQTDEYNEAIRKAVHQKSTLNKFEIGDLLILTDFYNIKETDVITSVTKNKKILNGRRFYTSEQIKITEIDEVIRGIPEFTENLLPVLARKLKSFNDILEKYVKTMKQINSQTKRKYNVYKLFVIKLTDIIANTIPATYQMYVVKDEHNEILLNDKKLTVSKIAELRQYYNSVHKEHVTQIDNIIIKPLWREFNKKFVEPFARVNCGNGITCHKSQSSTFYNVFVDVDDILKNNNMDEAKRCVYTALTRVSGELHLLI